RLPCAGGERTCDFYGTLGPCLAPGPACREGERRGCVGDRVQSCTDGEWTGCEPSERCNGIDDDGNPLTPDGIDEPTLGERCAADRECRPARVECMGGALQCRPTDAPRICRVLQSADLPAGAWQDALPSLALALTQDCDELWLSDEVHRISETPGAPFEMTGPLRVLGGFEGFEASPEERAREARSRITGDPQGDDIPAAPDPNNADVLLTSRGCLLLEQIQLDGAYHGRAGAVPDSTAPVRHTGGPLTWRDVEVLGSTVERAQNHIVITASDVLFESVLVAGAR